MKISPQTTQRLKTAWQRLPAEQRARYEPWLLKAHQHAVQVMRQPGTSRRPETPPEFALAYGILHDKLHEISDATSGSPDVTVGPDGMISGTGQFQHLDPRWADLNAALMEYEAAGALVPFQTQPQTLPLPEETRIALLGDWGTGDWGASPAPAIQVASAVRKLNPDYAVHLGDVYYMGSDGTLEWPTYEMDNLLAPWPGNPARSFALQGNHEMYAQGTGYFHHALGLALPPGRETPFTAQKGTSYFALVNSHWVIVGLDTAYAATNFYTEGNLNAPQLEFLAQVTSSNPGKKVLLLSHHNPLSEDGTQQLPLFSQVLGVLPSGVTAYWYWGHLHLGIVYKPVRTSNNITIHPRCAGHGGMPWGIASELRDASAIDWFESRLTKDATASDYPVRNGFALLELRGADLHETFYDQYGEVSYQG